MDKIKTIIVDDESRIRRGIERLVLSGGEQWEIVGTFSDGIEVIDFLEEQPIRIDLLITDVKMPEMDGLTLIKEVKKRNQDHDFCSIIVSGYDDVVYLQTAIREGASDYVLKPIDRTQFMEIQLRVKDKIELQRRQKRKWKDLAKDADKLAQTKQTQLLSETSSSFPEDISAMYWIKDFPDGLYQLFHVSTDEFPYKTRDYSPKDWGTMSYAVENIIDEVVNSFISDGRQSGWWWRDGGFNFWVLLFNSEQEVKEFSVKGEGFPDYLKSCINQYTPFSVSIAVSQPFEDLSILPIMKKQLHSLIRFRMAFGGNKVFSSRLADELGTRDVKPSLSSEMKEMAGKSAFMLGRAEMGEIEAQLNAFFGEITKLRSPDDIQFAIQYFMIQLYKVCLESTESGMLWSDLDELFEAVKAESNLNRIKNAIKQNVVQLHGKLLHYQQEHAHDPVVKAKAWIKEHISQKISIKDISDHVYMNPTYFCEFFKKQTGKTVLDYITDVRLEKARELLLDTDLNIGKISQQLGYQDTKYFSRLFKQKWGQLPSEYKKHIKTQDG
ncbi:response regulator transcription factor [Paenibacillus abyssi]|uniref:DNA-binding response regulator n=1 Tax=Paenibacillus abyssi TaxID=1340531 RepID=A0A917FSE2_9BACL|nr:response regulator [Paenibacillus abyssi]GGG01420.1 DNA-binding response regulator [Paenibacillus abyssi]